MISKDGTRIPDGAEQVNPGLIRGQKYVITYLLRRLAFISHMPHQTEKDDQEMEAFVMEKAQEEFEKARARSREARWDKMIEMTIDEEMKLGGKNEE